MTKEEVLAAKKDELNNQMEEELKPYIIQVVPPGTIGKITNEAKHKEIVEKYNNLYHQFENTLLTYQELREAEYLKDGITPKEMIVALWEKVVENRPESANALQAKREIIKNKIPKV